MTVDAARWIWLASEILAWEALHRRGSAWVGLGGSPLDAANQMLDDEHESDDDSP
jgi:hypothetical protein